MINRPLPKDISSLQKLRDFSKELFGKDIKVFMLEGGLGAGKTTFVSHFIRENLITDEELFEDIGVMSPTFSLINQYQTAKHSIVHADLYRLNPSDLEQIEELLYMITDSDYAFVEWPSKVPTLIESLREHQAVNIQFEVLDEQTRTASAMLLHP